MAIHYPLYITPPKKVNITSEQFDKLSFMGLSSLFCSFEYVIQKKKNKYILNMQEGHEHRFFGTPRFKDLKWFINREAELIMCHIPLDNPLIKSIDKYFSHLIME